MLLDNQFHIPERKNRIDRSGKEKGREGERRRKGGKIEEGEREGQRRKEGGREREEREEGMEEGCSLYIRGLHNRV